MKDISEYDFRKNVEKQDAVIRRFEIIGEAVKSISAKIRLIYNDVPWKKMAGMRDILAHQYFGVNYDLIWRVVNRDLPRLKIQIESIIRDLE